jgi:molybdate transport system substrate-binding protein
MTKFAITSIILLLTLSGCNNRNPVISDGTREDPQIRDSKKTLTIFTAGSLISPYSEIGEHYESQNPGVELTFNFAGSQQLAHQIAQGAPGDIFASADTRQMEAIVNTGRIKSQSPQIFTHNHLVVIFPTENPAGIQILQDLSKQGLKLVLAAEAVPVGNYSQQFLTKASQDPAFTESFKKDVLGNVVSYESNVNAVLNKVLLGEADAGIVYTSDINDRNINQLSMLSIPEELNVLADYLIAPLIDIQDPELAQDFIAFVLSHTGQEILSNHGFITVK